jgi:DNA-binding winged helix-turn-helix (wHTH) protein
LAILTGRPGEIVTREELQEQIWGKETFVDFDQSLNKAVNRIREALNDDAGTPQYVETVPRRGYRFIGRVEDQGKDGPTRPISADTSGPITHATSTLEYQPLQSLTTAAKDVTTSPGEPIISKSQKTRTCTIDCGSDTLWIVCHQFRWEKDFHPGN